MGAPIIRLIIGSGNESTFFNEGGHGRMREGRGRGWGPVFRKLLRADNSISNKALSPF